MPTSERATEIVEVGLHSATDGPVPRRPPAGLDRRALAHLKMVLKKLRLPGHLHTFRHSFISHALTSGVPPAIVRTGSGMWT